MSQFTKISAAALALAASMTDAFAVLQTKPGDTDLMWSHDLGHLNHADAAKACAELNLGGHTDWRLPTVEELFLLVDRTKYSPAIDAEYFPDCKSDWYWTSSSYAGGSDYAWFVYFGYGEAGIDYRGIRRRVRAVRSVARASQ